MHTFENENANEFENEKCILKMNTNFDVVFEVMCYMKIRTEKLVPVKLCKQNRLLLDKQQKSLTTESSKKFCVGNGEFHRF